MSDEGNVSSDAPGAVVFDIDGTWFRWQLFDAWIQEMVRLGIMPTIVTAMTEDARRAYKERRGRFDDFVMKQVSAYQDDLRLRGIRLEDAEFAARRVIERNGAEIHVFTQELSNAARELGMCRAVISGSPVEVVKAFAETNGITIVVGTEHPKDHRVYLGGTPKEWCFEKGNALRNILVPRWGIDLDKAVAIGDSAGDAEMFDLVRYPICFNPSRKLLDLARLRHWPVVFEKKDVRSILIPDADGRLVEADLCDILPLPLSARLEERLRAFS